MALILANKKQQKPSGNLDLLRKKKGKIRICEQPVSRGNTPLIDLFVSIAGPKDTRTAIKDKAVNTWLYHHTVHLYISSH